MSVRACVYVRVYVCEYLCVFMCVYVSVSVSICARVRVRVCVYITVLCREGNKNTNQEEHCGSRSGGARVVLIAPMLPLCL